MEAAQKFKAAIDLHVGREDKAETLPEKGLLLAPDSSPSVGTPVL